MKISQNGLAVIKYFESCSLNAYPDPGTGGAPWTIGWGHTGRDVVKGVVWTQAQADAVLLTDLDKFEKGVSSLVSIELKQGQFDALVCFVFNVGLKALENSTLLEMVNNKRFDQALAQFARWNKAGGRVMKGLIRRRAAESWLWRDATGAEAIRKGVASA